MHKKVQNFDKNQLKKFKKVIFSLRKFKKTKKNVINHALIQEKSRQNSNWSKETKKYQF